MRNVKYIAMFIAVCLTGINAFSQGSAWRGADVSAPVLVKYIGAATETVTITPTASNITVAGDSLVPSQEITIGSGGTLATVLAGLNAITNTSGALVIKAVYWEGLSTDVASNAIVATAFVLKNANVWEKPILWDTSTHLSYNVVPDNPTASGKPYGGYRLTGIMGEATGTGDVTVGVYFDGVAAFVDTVTSPTYVKALDNNTNTVNNLVSLGKEVNLGGGIIVPTGTRCLVRATRATTATTGGIGASLARP